MTSETDRQPNDELAARSLWLVLGYLLVLLVIYLSLAPSAIHIPIEEGDKLSHVFAYLVVMSWFANLYAGFGERLRFAIALVVLGVGLEFVQRWTGIRTFELWDMVASVAGVALGWVLAAFRSTNYLRLAEVIFRAVTKP